MTTVSADHEDPQRLPRRHGGGCCSGLAEWRGIFSATSPGGEVHSLRVDQNDLVLGIRDLATLVTLTPSKPGMVSLGLTKGRGVEVVQGAVGIGELGKTSFVLEQVPDAKDHFRIRTEDGMYFLASKPGAPISLTAEAGAGTIWKPHTTDQYGQMWAADRDYPSDETHGTHLWIFNRARDLIRESPGTGNEAERSILNWWLQDGGWYASLFLSGIKKGIYEADNWGDSELKSWFDKDTSGTVFSAHFWNPNTDQGGWWDPNKKINAFEYGKSYFKQSLEDEDPSSCGYNLGLAIHYLEDLTQPMHCGLYPNLPTDFITWLVQVAKVVLPEELSRYLSYAEANYRHENYEQWVLSKQGEWKLNSQELNQADYPVFRGKEDWAGYWRIAAKMALDRFDNWKTDDQSPIGRSTPKEKGARTPTYADTRWVEDASKMIKLAQQLVINLLFSWASLSVLTKIDRESQGNLWDITFVTGQTTTKGAIGATTLKGAPRAFVVNQAGGMSSCWLDSAGKWHWLDHTGGNIAGPIGVLTSGGSCRVFVRDGNDGLWMNQSLDGGKNWQWYDQKTPPSPPTTVEGPVGVTTLSSNRSCAFVYGRNRRLYLNEWGIVNYKHVWLWFDQGRPQIGSTEANVLGPVGAVT
jgi:hypothetical protein